jgi:lipoprotein-anchoring transpeptidase ErfK/SrfK
MNRREFLKISGLALAGAMASCVPLLAAETDQIEGPPPASLGRIQSWYQQPIRKKPENYAAVVEWIRRDTIIPLLATADGEASWAGNTIWYRTDKGYIHSAYVQPVQEQVQTKHIRRVDGPGLWAQVVVPVSGARWNPDSQWVMRKLYYATVYRIIDVVYDRDNQPWYRLEEGISKNGPGPYAPAWEMRILSRRELKPINPRIRDKRIQINRKDQTLTCYENGSDVFHTRVATGLRDTPTPRGEFSVLFKRHTRRMEGNINGDEYDLVGVPFPVYFTWSGVAIHGTYWHNDYGTTHSHGCVNVTPTAAKWIFRWVTPEITYDDYMIFADEENTGTRVVVL